MSVQTAHRTPSLAALAVGVLFVAQAAAQSPPSVLAQFGFGGPGVVEAGDQEDFSSLSTVQRVARMVEDPRAVFLAWKYHMHVVNVMWEDTGRFYGSAVGPNISDVTIQVQEPIEGKDEYQLSCMPVIRFPNFSDKTVDIPLDEFYVIVGNEKEGRPLQKITLEKLLGNLRKYLSDPLSWKGTGRSLLAPRDTHALVSAQACFLPIPQEGQAEFNPVIFNYQSAEQNPAVLTILATREGTSVTVIDNQRDAFQAGWSWGQRLFFNKQGERASLTGQRKSDYEAEQEEDAEDEPSVAAAGQQGLNLVLLIQVPLKHKPLQPNGFMMGGGMGAGMGGGGGGFFGGAGVPQQSSDVEEAVIGHGKVEGPFTEIDHLKIKRDPKFPIRVTVQFYKATSNGIVNDEDMAEIATQINRVYRDRQYVGSLVLDGPGNRPTEYKGHKVEPPWWWDSFWKRHEENTGMTRVETFRQLQQRFGPNWRPRTRHHLIYAVRQLDQPPPQPGGAAGGMF
jgi:hypothetical protein